VQNASSSRFLNSVTDPGQSARNGLRNPVSLIAPESYATAEGPVRGIRSACGLTLIVVGLLGCATHGSLAIDALRAWLGGAQ
jgi:hypothetical protein